MAVITRLSELSPPLTRRLFGALSTRAYRSTAARQLQYDGPSAESVKSASGLGMQWVIMGDPRADRSVYAEKLSKVLRVPHITMSGLFRRELHAGTPLYQKIVNAMNDGELLTKTLVFGSLADRLKEEMAIGGHGFILDGIPRTVDDAEFLDRVGNVNLVINFKCMSSDMSPLDLPLSQDDKLKSGMVKVDTTDTYWNEKIFNPQNKLLEDYYREQGKLLNFQVGSTPDETWRALLAALQLQHMDA